MRARMYDFLWIMFTAPWILAWMTFGGAGWLLIALLFAVFFLRSFVFVLQVSNYSDKIVSDVLSNSTDGKAFDRCDALGEVTVFIKDPKTGMAHPIKTHAWPGVRMLEPGTGEWGLAKKWGGHEHGFIIVSEHLFLQLSDAGNTVLLGPTVTLRPMHSTTLQLLRRVKPTQADPRRIIPDQWWNKLIAHPRFDVKKSAIHLVLDPMFPIIVNERINGVETALLVNPGKDATKDRPAIPPLTYRLVDVVGPNSPILDLRPEMRQVRDAQIEAIRDWAGKEIDIREQRIQYLESALAAASAVDLPMTQQEMARERIMTTVAGSEQTGERMQR